MGCANSKEVPTVKSPKKPGTPRRWKKRLLIPIVEEFLSRFKRADPPPPLPIVLQQSESDPEVIDVVALMKGLEDDHDEQQEQEQDRGKAMPESLTETSSMPESGTDQDADESSSFCDASSPDSTSRNICTSPISPRSPLLFGGAHRSKRCSETAPDLVVARNFSFNLRSCADQAATPKLILGSASPLLRCGDDFKHRLVISGSKDSSNARSIEGDNENELALLSSFESMIEQIRNDNWIEDTGIERPDLDDHSDSVVVSSQNRSEVPDEIRYIGVDRLERQGDLDPSRDRACRGCGGANLVPCLDCNGSRRFIADDGGLESCTGCTVNGMVSCPLCV